MAERPNVVLIVMDTTRARDVTRATAPGLLDVASEGTRFTRAFATAPWTLPSHASMFTGTYPSRHGAHADHERLGDELPTLAEAFGDAGYETAAVSSNTWITPEFGFGRGFDAFHRTWQYVQSDDDLLWDVVQVREESTLRSLAQRALEGDLVTDALNAAYATYSEWRGPDDGAERTTEWVADWLDGRDDDRPFFLFANCIEPHLEYRPPERLAERFLSDEPSLATARDDTDERSSSSSRSTPSREDAVSYEAAMEICQDPWAYLAGEVDHDEAEFEVLRALYRAEVAYLDERIRELRDALVAADEWEDTVFVVTGDHGENVGDHGLMDHQYCLYDTLLHVPLVVHGGAFAGGGEVDDLVSHADLAPTLLDAAGIDAPAARSAFQGRSAHPDADTPARRRVFAEYAAPQPSMAALRRHVGELPESVSEYDRSLRTVRTETHKFVRGSDGSRELYDLRHDPGETEDVAGAHPERVRDLEAALDDWLDSFERVERDDEVDISGRQRAQLEQLGYLQ